MTAGRRDWILIGSAVCAFVVTASAEFTLATACSIPEYIAWAVPGALDLYVLRALRVRRDVLVVVLALVLVNAASHLVSAGLLPVTWALITAVSAIAPLVLWRVHVLGVHGVQTQADSGVVSTPESAGESAPEFVPGLVEYTPDLAELPPYPEFNPAAGLPYSESGPEYKPERSNVLTMPVFPEGYEDEYMPSARLLDSESMSLMGKYATVRELREEYNIGSARAGRIRKTLDSEYAGRSEDDD